jgi:chorismate mutase
MLMKPSNAPRRLPNLSPKRQRRPLIIAGPCSAETEAQTLATARELARDRRVQVFRAGIWKPRTRPDCFAGIGVTGLSWLQRVRRETGLPVAVEAARGQHVYEALKFGVDVLWIGARTTANPFSVQEVADALQGVDVPVWVKNPVNPDLSLWLGALERLTQAGIRQLGAIHRGFSTSDPGPYRNTPGWELALALRREAPEVPILCDPSHIGGRRELLADLAQQGLCLGLDGLMVEAHIQPEAALSDADQQVTPVDLSRLLDAVLRHPRSHPTEDPLAALETLRGEIDRLDGDLIRLLSRRNDVAARIGRFKKEHRLDAFQGARWQLVLENRLEQAARLGLDRQLVREIYLRIHDISLRVQAAAMRR